MPRAWRSPFSWHRHVLRLARHPSRPRDARPTPFNWARPFTFYGIFWIVLRLFPDARSLRRLLIAGLVCGAITGVLALVMQFTGSLTDIFQGSGGQQIYTQATQAGLGGLKRIRQPGLAFSYSCSGGRSWRR